MQEEQQDTAVREAAPMAQKLLGKVLSHKLFSDRVMQWILLGLTFLLPIFFIPGNAVAPEFAKMFMLEVFVLFGIFAWSLGRLRDGKIELPKSMLLGVALLLIIDFVVSAVVSPAPSVSFFGSGYDLGTVNTLIVLFLLMFLTSIMFNKRDRVLSLYLAFVFSAFVLMLYQLIRHIFGPDVLSFGIFTNAVATPAGKWNDFSAIVGALMALTLSTSYFFPQNKTLRIPAIVIFVVGLFFLLLVDFTVLWYILGAFVLLLIALSVYEGEQTHKQAKALAHAEGREHAHKSLHKRVSGHLPKLATVLLLVCVVYGSGLSALTWGKDNLSISSVVAKTLHSSPYSEVVLTPKTTFEIVKATISDSPLFGSGPNRFASSFLLHKSSDINKTAFWDTPFEFGIGRIPTYFGTTGVIGMILWLVFAVLLFMKSRKILRLFNKDRIAAYLAFSLFVLTIYFWSLAAFYLPNIAVFSLAFIFAGALVAFLEGEGVVSRITLGVGVKSKTSFVLTPLVVIIMIGTIAASVLLYRQTSSLVAYRDAQLAVAANDVAKAETSLLKANELSQHDLYYRSLSNVALVKLTRLAGEQLPADQFQAKANQLIADARGNAESAIKLDPTNFENYLQLGGVYDTLGSLGIQNTTLPARQSYQQALLLNPKSPRVLFVLARLEYLANDHAKAKEYLSRALVERPNYLEAVSFLVQLDLQDKNSEDAENVLKAAITAEPTNFLLHFALGYLDYAKRDYASAATEFEGAVILNPVYADAKYFLGLSYSKIGRHQDAITQFTDVQTLNPDNKDVASILTNLKAGRDPFAPPYVAPQQPVSDALKELNKAPAPTKPATN